MDNSSDITFSSLDPSQKNTFRAIDNDEANLHVVFGPPGTGKSQLVVSLLERLASEDKKVLFVSQNTEALKVIERMIKKTEATIGYPGDNKYISLLDFCLMLYNPSHRYLKYLREQYTRVSSKQLPTINKVNSPDNIKYNLQYTKLNHDENYSVSGDVIGFDELVRYYLRYVNQTMAPEPLRSFEQVNVRSVFDQLDNYKNPDYFAEFNQPRRELILLSTKNDNLSLPVVRSKLKAIKDSLSSEWIESFPSKSTIEVSDYLLLLKEYVTAIDLLDVYKISTENKDINELVNTFREFIDEDEAIVNRIERIEEHVANLKASIPSMVHGPTHESKKINLNDSTLKITEKNLDEALNDRSRMVELAKGIIQKYPDVEHVGVNDLWIGLAQIISNLYHDTVEDSEGNSNTLTAEDIGMLNDDLQVYDAKTTIKRKLSGIPTSFKEKFKFTNSKDLDMYKDGLQETFTCLMQIMEIDNSDIKSVLKIGLKGSSKLLKHSGVDLPKEIKQATDAFLPVHELITLLYKYGISRDDFNKTKTQLKEQSEGLDALRSAKENKENKKLYLSSNMGEFINTFNTTLDIKKNNLIHADLLNEQKKLRSDSYKQNDQYLSSSTDSVEYVKRVKSVYEYLKHKEKSLSQLINNIELPDNVPVSTSIENIDKAINEANLSDSFSDYFFEVGKEQTLKDWLTSVSVLETYNNDNEIANFVEHNNSVNAIRLAMGAENKKYIDEVLANDITYDVFAARIVNVLIGEIFGRADISDKKRVAGSEIIRAYDTYLKNQKALMYRENLRHIYGRSFEGATKELSKQSTLQAGGKSTMDKFRHNTNLITDAFPIICATPKDVSKYIAANKGLFDYVIFDEASQLLPGQAIPSIYRAKKAVIIGDPHQMPPGLNSSFTTVDQSEDEFDDLGESILDLVIKQPSRQHHLKVHYRSKYNKLFEPSRGAIYSEDGIEPIFEAELANGAPIDIVDDLGHQMDESGYDKNFYKICESVEEHLAKESRDDFCILFTRSDVLARFKDFLAEVGDSKFGKVTKQYSAEKILLSTVTNCQGIEGAYTIIYMHHYERPGSMWFFKEPAGAYKRLNVSITRQRKGLTLLLADTRSHWTNACDEKLNRDTTGPNTYKSAKLMKALLESAGEQADTTYLDRRLGQNASWFDSPLTEQLYDKLTDYYSDKIGQDIKIYSEVGWNLLIPTGEGIDKNETNVGFRIDLGIYSVKYRKFVLGIEMDGAMYHSGFDKEHSDFSRQKVLEEKGWDLYRIWSTNWLNDNEREFNKLTEKIDKELA